MQSKENIQITPYMMERFRIILKVLYNEPLDDPELERIRLQQTIAFNRILGEYVRGKMNRHMFMKHVKGYLHEWKRKLKKKEEKEGEYDQAGN